MLFAKHQPKLIYLSRVPSLSDVDGNNIEENDTDSVPDDVRLRTFDLVFYLVAMITYIADIVTDLVVAYTHYSEKRVWSAVLIAAFALVPSIILNVVAYIWMSDEDVERRRRKRKALGKIRSLICVLQGGPILYYWRALRAGIRVKRSTERAEQREHYLEMIVCERDATLLRFFEAFMESCPQLVIQGFLLASIVWSTDPRTDLPRNVYILAASVFLSLLSVAFSISNQHRTLRFSRRDKLNMLVCETVIQLLWRFGTILSRFLVIVLLCLARTFWIVPFFAVHYLLSVLHIVALQSVSIGVDGSPTVETGLILINGCIHFFAPFNMAEGRTRARYATAYGIEAIEAAAIFFITLRDNSFSFPYKFEFLYLSIVSAAIGFAFMLIYYMFFHPTKRLSSSRERTEEGRVGGGGERLEAAEGQAMIAREIEEIEPESTAPFESP